MLGFKRIVFEINGFRYLVPSDRLLSEILPRVHPGSVEAFCLNSDRAVESIAHELRILPLYLEIEQALCVCFGGCWEVHKRHTAIQMWCRLVFPGIPQSSQKTAAQIVRYRAVLGQEQREKSQPEKSQREDRSKNFPQSRPTPLLLENAEEYRAANAYLDAFFDSVTESSDPTIQAMLSAYLKALESVASGNRALPNNEVLPYYCPYCGRILQKQRSRGVASFPTSCNRTKCKRLYKADCPSSQAKMKTPNGWVKAYERKPCRGLCGRDQVNLNSDFLCRKCFPEVPAYQ